ncbi:MAG: permease [Rhodobacterales bacterium]|nr:MAG: permease [Rhodobacterales bacterium]
MSLAFALMLVALFGLAAIGMPVGQAILVASLLYLGLAGLDPALAGEQALQGLYGSFVLLAVPLFIVAANIMNAGTISDRLLRFVEALVGRFRGGLGHVNVLASLVFSGMSGSALADAAGIGRITIGMMTRDGRYSRGYAAAITAASATIGPIIPPSIPMVLYALVSNQSVGALFLAGVVPGLMMAAALMAVNARIARRRGFGAEAPVPLAALPRKTARAFPALLMPAILLYGIYGGIATPTEAAAIAALYALILAGPVYRALTLRGLVQVFVDSARASAAVGLVIAGALILNFVVVTENIPAEVASALAGRDMPPIVFLIGVNLTILLLGALLDATTLILVVVPVFLPAARELGVDLVHFGVLVVVNAMIGLITPPYGMLLFVINAVTGIGLREIVGEIRAFLAVLVVALLAMILFPGLVLWLPRLAGYGV